MPKSYVKPKDVTSPRGRWQTVKVLRDGAEGTLAVAVGLWDGEPRLAHRWNGNKGDKWKGFPISHFQPSWMLYDDKDAIALLKGGGPSGVSKTDIQYAKKFMGIK